MATRKKCSARIEKLKERVLNTTPSVDLENACIITDSFMKTEGEPLVSRKAKAFLETCRSKTIFIAEGELIVGHPGSKIRAGVLAPQICWPVLGNEIDTISTRKQDPFLVTEDDKRVFHTLIRPYWKGKSFQEACEARIPDEIRKLGAASVVFYERRATRTSGEFTADYESIINNGIRGIREDINQRLSHSDVATPEGYEAITYLNALLMICDGITLLSKRYAHLAATMARTEEDLNRKAELERIADVCARVPYNPARNFWEAVQSLFFYQTCMLVGDYMACLNLGRLDQYLYPYYKKDIEDGSITEEQALELLECLWVKLSESAVLQNELTAKFTSGYNMFQNVCCGGITESGQDAVNDLSYMVLQASMEVRLHQPSLSVRYNKGKNPDTFLRKVVELVKCGTGFPSIHNDESGIKMVMQKGVPLEEAYNWNPCGCVETSLMGKLRNWTDSSNVNLGSVVELALLNGKNRLTQSDVGIQTGDPRQFVTYQEFEDAVRRQFAYLVKRLVEVNQILEMAAEQYRILPVVSLSFKDCIEKAKDYECGGAKYNIGNAIVMVGIADLTNSLAAIKKLIYEDRRLTWDKLLEALDRNFEGCEEIRQLCLSAPKYGNDIPEVDEIATEMFRFVANEIGKHRIKHGKMISGLFPVTAHIPSGLAVGALPSGRQAWTPLTDGISPTPGTDVNGPTSILKSASKIDHALHTSGTLINMKLDPSLLSDDKGVRNLMNLIKSMVDLGIYQIQFNVVSPETLKKAQEEPENYRDLLVRVAGYSAYFVELDRIVQDEIIARTTQMSVS